MKRRTAYIAIAVIAIAVSIGLVGGGRWLWHVLLAMHGVH